MRSSRLTLLVATLSIPLVATLSIPLLAAQIRYDGANRVITVLVEYSNPTESQDRLGESTLSIDGLPNTVGAGLPILPVEPVKILVPFGHEVAGYSMTHSGEHTQAGRITRSTGQLPLSWQSQRPTPPPHTAQPDFDGPVFPKNRIELTTQTLHGTTIAVLNIYPVVYHRSGNWANIRQAAVSISLRESARNRSALRPHQKTEVAHWINNKEAADTWPENSSTGYDYLILSTPELIAYNGTGGWSDYQAGLTQQGLSSRVFDIKQVISTSSGADPAEKVRNFIRTEYESNGIRYALFAGPSSASGNTAYIPSRALWSKIRAYMGYWFDLEATIPSDHYFAALDGGFDGNKNGKWGEPSDGDNGGDVDFLPEITVGRAVLNSQKHLQDFVRKTLLTHQTRLPQNILLAGEMLFQELNLFGDDYMEQLIGECTDHGFTTHGFTPAWPATKLYDRGKKWTGADALTAIKAQQFGMIHHLGHSNENNNMRLTSSQISKMENATPFFYYTQGCLAGNHVTGSFVDKLVSAPKAAVAAIGNTSYGLAPEDPEPSTTHTPGASQMLHRQFVHALMAESEFSLAQAHQESKRAFVNFKSAQEIRWVTWTATFFGDPSLKLR